MTDTPVDDALRAAVERVLRNVEGLEASADEIERNWPRTSENTTLVAWKRRDAADIRLILSALTAPPDTRQSGFVTEEMVERGARAMCSSKGYPPDEIFHAQGETPMRMWQFFKEDARAVLAAAGGGK